MKAVTSSNVKSWGALKLFNRPKEPSQQLLDPNSISAVLDGERAFDIDNPIPDDFASNPQVELPMPAVDDWCAALASESPLRPRIGDLVVPERGNIAAVISENPLASSQNEDMVMLRGGGESSRESQQLGRTSATAGSGTILGFDALRAFAIVGVVAYHLMPKAVPGGYLGVDIFFVLSGFLITRGLASTWVKHQNVNLKDFFARRFNRIVPSLLVVLLTCATIGLLVGQDVLVGANKQIFGALTFTSNWVTIFAGGDYFAATTPALFANLWYLALDVQFYLLWPPLLVLLFHRAKATRLWAWAAGIGLASAGLMVGLSFTGAGQTRLYEGTDTHFFSLMFGSALALAFAYNSGVMAKAQAKLTAWGAGKLGWIAGCALVLLFFTLQWVSLASFRGLMVLAALLTVLILFLLVSFPQVGAVLERKPLQFIGKHSYGIFLWHWPLLVIITGALGQSYSNPAWWVIVAVLGASIAFTLATEKLVNTPLHHLGVKGYFGGFKDLTWVARVGVASIAAVGVVGTVTAVATAPSESLITRQILAGAEQAAQTRHAITFPVTGLSGRTTQAPTLSAADRTYLLAMEAQYGTEFPAAFAELDDVIVPSPTGDQVTAIGDSVLLGAAPQLIEQLPGIYIDGAISRQFYAGKPVVEQLKEEGQLRPYVLIALATNGTVTEQWMDELMEAIGPDHTVLFVTAYADRKWNADANAQLQAATERYPGQVHLVDWKAAVDAEDGLLGGDGIHPNQVGMERYAQLVVKALMTLDR